MIRMPQYPEVKGVPLMEDGYEIRKFIKEAAYQARIMPHQLETDDETYKQAYHRFTGNQFHLADIEIVRDKILNGLVANKKIHDDAFKELSSQLISAHDEHSDALHQCIDMVDENKRRVSELHTEVRNVMDGLFRS